MDYMHDIDKYDDDVKENEERMKIPFTLNFKTISTYMLNLQEGLKEVTDDYPKKELIKLMVGIEIVLAILIIFSYKAFVIVTLPMMLFYFLAHNVTILSICQAFLNGSSRTRENQPKKEATGALVRLAQLHRIRDEAQKPQKRSSRDRDER